MDEGFAGSKSSLRFVPNIARSPFFQSFGSKLAIHSRYRERRFFCIPYCYLQGSTVRPVPCNYNVIQQSAPFHDDDTIFFLKSNRVEDCGNSLSMYIADA
jgi:hypothetical protein